MSYKLVRSLLDSLVSLSVTFISWGASVLPDLGRKIVETLKIWKNFAFFDFSAKNHAEKYFFQLDREGQSNPYELDKNDDF